ncbi:hypothetical protein E2C01_088977 [Portunus trituberculatus]|uniref:Uncharacterized protein n=1 Tax=Portunus trituberculatus TaxID=210409 RepID=A0A5B7JCA4_PORTR|nr:hypothetical protein [Portunus trituberculatus]
MIEGYDGALLGAMARRLFTGGRPPSHGSPPLSVPHLMRLASMEKDYKQETKYFAPFPQQTMQATDFAGSENVLKIITLTNLIIFCPLTHQMKKFK